MLTEKLLTQNASLHRIKKNLIFLHQPTIRHQATLHIHYYTARMNTDFAQNVYCRQQTQQGILSL